MLEFSSLDACSTDGNSSSPLVGFSSNDTSCDGNVALLNDFESSGGCSNQGAQGPEGFSAYQIAVFNGFIGTEEEWLASLQGEPGEGVPPGGIAGQILAKIDDTSYNTEWIDNPDLAGYVPYTGATQDVDLGEFGIKVGNIELDLTPTVAPTTVGSIVWNDTAGTADIKLKGGNVTLQVGQETVARVVNKTATNITLLESKYQAVRVTGAQGQRPKVDLAMANNDLNSTTTLGIVTENILNNQEGFITTSGQVQEINTTGSLQGETWADGDVLYLSGTIAGQSTNIKPIAPIHTVIIGFVEYAHAIHGKIFVKVDNGYELEELHNVSAIAPNNNEVLTYDTPTLLWKPKTISTILGYTPFNLPSLTSGSVLFSNGTTIAQDNTNFFWDNVNKKLGIGTSTFVGTNKLTVNGRIGGPTYSGTYLDVTGGIPELRGNSGIGYYSAAGNHIFYGGSSVEYMRLTTAGLLGIGTNSPSEILHISGTTSADRSIRLDRDISSTNGQFYLKGITIGGSPALLIGSGNSISGNFTGISYMGGSNNVGIGMSTTVAPTSPLTVGRNITQTVSSPYFFISATSGLIYTQNTISNGNTLSFISGETYWDGNAGMGNVRPINILSVIRNTAGITMRGGYFSTRTANLGIGTFMSGVTGEIILSGTGAVTNAVGQEISLLQDGIKTTTNLYGIKIQDLTNSAGTITNTYGIYLGNLTAGTQTNAAYGIYQSSATNKNYFAGNVGIGTLTPVSTLQVENPNNNAVQPLSALPTNASILLGNTGNSVVLAMAVTNAQVAYLQGRQKTGTGAAFDISLNPLGGNIGIGTIAPSAKLHVLGSSIIQRLESIVNSTQLQFYNTDATNTGNRNWSIGTNIYNWGDFNMMSSPSSGTAPSTNYTYLTITKSGNFGINAVAPIAKLQVSQGTLGSGTVATNGTITLTGTDTEFNNTFKVGDTITVSGETVRTIATIVSNFILTVNTAFTTTASALTYTLVGGTRLSVLGNGNVGIGTTAPLSTFHVIGDTLLKGNGNTNATNALTVQNSDGNLLFRVGNGGALSFRTDGLTSITPTNDNFNPAINGNSLRFTSNLLSTAQYGYNFINSNGSVSWASGTGGVIYLYNGFNPTSGTGQYRGITLENVINQTGGANGITRGFYVTPTLTAAADWRSIEWSNNTGWGLYGAGTASNYLGGSLGIGTTTPTAKLQVKGDGTNPIARFETSTAAIAQQFYDTSMIGFGNINPIYAGIYGHSSIDPNAASASSLGIGLISNQSSSTASYGFGIKTTNGSSAAQWITGTGGLIKIISSGFIPSAAGNGNYRNLEINYSLNGTNGVQTGTATGIYLNATETALNGMTHNLMDLQVSGSSKFSVINTGAFISNANSIINGTLSTSGIVSLQNNSSIFIGGLRTYSAGNGVEIGKFNTTTNGTFTGAAGTQIGAAFFNTVNQSSTAGFTDILLNSTEVALGSGGHNLIDLQVGGVSKASITNNGQLIIDRSFGIKFQLSSVISAPSNGTLVFQNNAGTDFTRIMLGGTTNAFPSIKRNGSAIDFRLADDSGYANINAGTGAFIGSLSSTQGTGVLSGTVNAITSILSIVSPAGSGLFRLFNATYTINASGAQTGNTTGYFLNATETNLNGMTHNLMDLQVGSVSKFKVINNGVINAVSLIATGDIMGGTSAYLGFTARTVVSSPSNGVLLLTNNAVTDFTRLQLGGTTNLFPAIKRNGTVIEFKLADDSGFCAIGTNKIFMAGQEAITEGSGMWYSSSHPTRYSSFTIGSGQTTVTAMGARLHVSGSWTFADTVEVPSAIVAVTSTTKGFLPPRMTTGQKNAIVSPATGLIVFDTDLGKLCVFAVTWQTITSA